MPVIRAVFFDLWDTLIYNEKRNNIMAALSGMMGVELARESWKRFENAFMKRRYRNEREAAADIASHFGINNDFVTEKIAELMKSAIKPKIFPDVIPELERIGENRKIGIISNTMSLGIEGVIRKLSGHVDDFFLSCDLGVIKPDPEIFRKALASFRVKPEEAIMFGDNYLDDIEPAERMGMRAVLVKRDFPLLTWHENRNHRNTIKTLSEIGRFIK